MRNFSIAQPENAPEPRESCQECNGLRISLAGSLRVLSSISMELHGAEDDYWHQIAPMTVEMAQMVSQFVNSVEAHLPA